MKAITKYKLTLKLLNSFSMDLIVKKHHATYYFTFQPPKLSNWTQNKKKTEIISPYDCSSKSRRT